MTLAPYDDPFGAANLLNDDPLGATNPLNYGNSGNYSDNTKMWIIFLHTIQCQLLCQDIPFSGTEHQTTYYQQTQILMNNED